MELDFCNFVAGGGLFDRCAECESKYISWYLPHFVQAVFLLLVYPVHLPTELERTSNTSKDMRMKEIATTQRKLKTGNNLPIKCRCLFYQVSAQRSWALFPHNGRSLSTLTTILNQPRNTFLQI